MDIKYLYKFGIKIDEYGRNVSHRGWEGVFCPKCKCYIDVFMDKDVVEITCLECKNKWIEKVK